MGTETELNSIANEVAAKNEELTQVKTELSELQGVFKDMMLLLKPDADFQGGKFDPKAMLESYRKAPPEAKPQLPAAKLQQMHEDATAAHTGITGLQNTVSYLDSKYQQLAKDVIDIQRYLHEWNILVHGLSNLPTKREGCSFDEFEFEFIEFLVSTLNQHLGNHLYQPLQPSDVDRAHILYQGPDKKDKPVVIIRFARRVVRNNVFFKRRNLKGSKISITDHLTKFHHDLMNEAHGVFGSDNTWTSMGRVFVSVNGKREEIKSGFDIKRVGATLTPPVHYDVDDVSTIPLQNSGAASSARGRKPYNNNNNYNNRHRDRNYYDRRSDNRNQQKRFDRPPRRSNSYNPHPDLRYNP